MGKSGTGKENAGRKKEVKSKEMLLGKRGKEKENAIRKKEVKRKETEKKPVICLTLC